MTGNVVSTGITIKIYGSFLKWKFSSKIILSVGLTSTESSLARISSHTEVMILPPLQSQSNQKRYA